jgi:hypothetical protein
MFVAEITTTQGDRWLGLFNSWPETPNILEALRMDRRTAVWQVRLIEFDPTRKAYALECAKWKRLQDVVKLADIPRDLMQHHAACKVATPSDDKLGSIAIQRQRVFRSTPVDLRPVPLEAL